MYDRYQGLIFDMDGTLFNTEPTHRLAWHQVLSRYGMVYDESSMVKLNGSPSWRIAQAIIHQHQMEMDPYHLAALKTQIVENMLLEMATPLPAVEIVLAYKGKRPMALGTGSEHRMADRLLCHFGLRDCFQAIVGADDVAAHKPAPETFLRCAALLGVEPQACIVFEDADFGIQAAQCANMAWVDQRGLH